MYRNIRDADLRGRKHLCMVESELVVKRLINSPAWQIHSLFMSPQKYERLKDHLNSITVPIYVADVSLMSEITGFYIHRGVLAAVHRICDAVKPIESLINELNLKQTFSLLLAEGITNIDNMGTLFRNAAAFDVDGIILDPTCCDPLYRKSIRVSMGHVFSIPWSVSSNWRVDLQTLKSELDVQLIGCETNEKAIPMWDVQRSDRIALVMGEEKSGLSHLTMTLCDVIAEIPMNDKVPSLNVGVASAVGLYELLLRHRFDSGKTAHLF